MFWLLLAYMIAQTTLLVMVGLWVHHEYKKEKERLGELISNTLHDFVNSPDENTPSPLAVLMDTAATLLAARFMHQIKSMVGGIESKAVQGEQLAMLGEASGQSPLLAVLANLLPKRVRNKLARNPQILQALASLGGNHRETHAEVTPRSHRD